MFRRLAQVTVYRCREARMYVLKSTSTVRPWTRVYPYIISPICGQLPALWPQGRMHYEFGVLASI